MATLWTPRTQTSSATAKDNADIADTGLADVGLSSPNPDANLSSTRPQLQRNQPQPPPPHQPPPPPSPQQIGNAADSLSLMQLKRIVTEFPRVEPTVYAFSYCDTASYEEEIDEWFSYNSAEFQRLRRARDSFERRWKKLGNKSWNEAERSKKKAFVQKEVNGLQATDLKRRCKSLQTILHTTLGVWHESAGDVGNVGKYVADDTKPRTVATKAQVEAIKDGILLVTECGGVAAVYEVLRKALDRLW